MAHIYIKSSKIALPISIGPTSFSSCYVVYGPRSLDIVCIILDRKCCLQNMPFLLKTIILTLPLHMATM